jgi:hypothetical protein
MVTEFFKENGTLLTILVLGSLFMIFAGLAMLKGILDPGTFMEWAGGIFGLGTGGKLLHSNFKRGIDAALAVPGEKPLVGPHAEGK